MKNILLTMLFFSGFLASNIVFAAPVIGTTKATTTISDASSLSLDNLKNLSIDEVEAMIGKKLTLKEKVALKYVQHKLKKSGNGGDDTDRVLIYVLCFFLPPLAVFLLFDIGDEFWINVLLTCLCGLPGMIHAFIICYRELG